MKTNKEYEVIRLTGYLEGLTRTYNALIKITSSDSRYDLVDEMNRVKSEIIMTEEKLINETK